MPERNWTAAQLEAIGTVDRGVLVSAGAGSGKTAVLAERCARIICDLHPPCDVDRLLVVTFTDAAATEMRQRIERVLRERLAATPTNARLQRQLALLETASISTLHAFCKRTLGRYFAHADIDPRAPQLDENEIGELREEAARSVFDRMGERTDAAGEAFLSLLETYGNTNDWPLMQAVLQVTRFLESVIDPDGWLARAAEYWKLPAGGGLPAFWREKLVGALQAELEEQIGIIAGHLERLQSDSPPRAGEFAADLECYRRALERWRGGLSRTATDGQLEDVCRQIREFQFPKTLRKNKNSGGSAQELEKFERYQKILKDTKDNLFDAALRDGFARFTIADWVAGMARAAPHVNTFLALVEAARAEYAAAKRDLGVMDFADLERRTLELLRDPASGVAGRLRDKFRFVLVDEFQDINPVQAEILRLVSRDEDAGREANLFTVGDVKQSIYRFRLAEPRVFLDRAARLRADPANPRGRAIDLRENFRSSPRIIAALNHVFERLIAADLGGIDYDEHTRLVAGRTSVGELAGPVLELHYVESEPTGAAGPGGTRPEAWDWEQVEREAYVIAERLRAIHQDGVPFGDMAILLRSVQAHAGLFIRTLAECGVPATAESVGGFFESVEILDVLALLQLLDNQRQDIPLAAVLRSPLLGPPLNDDELAEIRALRRGRTMPFFATVGTYAREGPQESLRTRLAATLAQLTSWRRRFRLRPLADVLWALVEETGYLARVSGLRDGARRRANLIRLHEMTRSFGRFNRQGLYRFLRYLDGLRDAERDADAGNVATPGADVVRVMTIHKSKGLEFPVVVVGELGKKFNLRDARGAMLYDRNMGVAFKAVDLAQRVQYPTLPHRLVSRQVRDESLAEELRVLYVALTRAKERLILVGSGKLRDVAKSRAEFADHSGVLPLRSRANARGLLDWLTAALCSLPGDVVSFEDESALCAVKCYDADSMREWKKSPIVSAAVRSRLELCEKLDLPKPSAMTATMRDTLAQLERRLTTAYATPRLARLPAVAAASVIKGQWQGLTDDAAPARESGPRLTARFDPPTLLSATAAEPDAAARGTWTHAFLELVDLRRPCDEADLRRQQDELIASGRLDFPADGIDLPAIAWFFGGELGRRLRDPASRVLREWPFVIGVPPSRLDPAAREADGDEVVLVRGIVDCLLHAGGGWELIDYKTDALQTPQAVDQRAAEYRGQLDIYGEAVRATFGAPVARRSLVFLGPRRVVDL